MNGTIGFIELIKLIKKRWYILFFTFLFGFFSAYSISAYFMAPQYSSSTNMLVSRNLNGQQNVNIQEIETNIQLINTYRDVISDSVVLSQVIEAIPGILTEEELSKKIKVNIQENSQIFEIEVIDTDPARSAEIANLVAITFKDNIDDIMNIDNVAILSPAVSNNEPVSPNILFNSVIGAISGIFIGIAVILLREMLDTKVHDEKFITEELDLLRLGSISSIKNNEKVSIQTVIKNPEINAPVESDRGNRISSSHLNRQ
ncbi:YveK family protein [Lacticigenium naphthae]|uniref:YveK family protein n=1 Tax=Lacticigenium naphthae TaxID=515351 RepID=UPI0003FD9024|nr:Wzz/FepE/Etk N-terminal domain-containing protein [Lacticigenium naphthae]